MATMHIAIAGGGLMGSLIAWQLARSGKRVTVLEKCDQHSPAAAGYTAAAMVAPYSERPISDKDVFRLGQRSLALWPQLIADLNQDSGERHRFHQNGSLLVAHPADRAEMEDLERHLTRHGLEGDSAIERLGRQRIGELEPELKNRFDQGLWMSTEGHLDNRPLLQTLHRTIVSLGGEVCYGQMVDTDGRVWKVNGQLINADFYLDARGVGAQPDMPQLRGVRGEVLWIQTSEVRISRPVRLLHPRYRLYLVPKGESRYILGATELESDDRSPVTVRSALELLSALYTLSPRFSEASILEMSSNLRPALPHHRPEIVVDGNVVSVNGLFRHGYLLAPALLERLAAQVEWFDIGAQGNRSA